MAAATSDRVTQRIEGVSYGDPVAAGETIYRGVMVALDAAGNAVNATAAGTAVRGVAKARVNNSAGAAGDETVVSEKGVFLFMNNGLDRTDIGNVVKVTDNQTVGGAGAANAGTLVDIDASGGAWVQID
jgi:predicted ribonuclease toxin of YeeF-YezG toxin-antitoxin module